MLTAFAIAVLVLTVVFYLSVRGFLALRRWLKRPKTKPQWLVVLAYLVQVILGLICLLILRLFFIDTLSLYWPNSDNGFSFLTTLEAVLGNAVLLSLPFVLEKLVKFLLAKLSNVLRHLK